eukprot:TRINITY_DN5554_c0_g4_i1.p2 TRINITY_DN5554_c0_g4~~TRINITY_DN5554_c0_g4_i1.p2  ORF type:complete len:142 (+),score=1.79 TRINITY_DN5554_c0_g4_i1:290-715(+)
MTLQKSVTVFCSFSQHILDYQFQIYPEPKSIFNQRFRWAPDQGGCFYDVFAMSFDRTSSELGFCEVDETVQMQRGDGLARKDHTQSKLQKILLYIRNISYDNKFQIFDSFLLNFSLQSLKTLQSWLFQWVEKHDIFGFIAI